uniref:Uncharacterized protein n=1 Tax=Panagrolaimus sp. ES5 TaxID=591445 RepID=A0AC34FZ73_9BILA
MIELIAKDKKEMLQFEGKCKLRIDAVSKLLLVEPEIEEFKMISAMFTWKFFAEKNILFVFAEHDFQDFVLIFDDSNKSKIVFDILLKKGAILGDKALYQQRFLPSLFEEISKNNESSMKMKEILVTWIEKHDEKEKEEYFKCILLHPFEMFNTKL